jgi:hypothetical protein
MHFVDDHQVATDPEGFDAPDETAARLMGMKAAGEIIAEEMAHGRQTVSFMLCLEDENHNRIGTLPVAASVAGFASPRFLAGKSQAAAEPMSAFHP